MTELLQYFSIPVIAALIGWITNLIAIRMTFYPLEFKGIKPYLGWQGIIPAKSIKMSGKVVDVMTKKLLKIEEEFDKIDSVRVAEEMKPNLELLCLRIINEVMHKEAPAVWRTVPTVAKKKIYQMASADFPMVIKQMMDDIKAQSSSLIDFETMIQEELTRDKAMLNKLFMECGKKEFAFIERSGLYFGFLFGIVQMALWYYFPAWWILPLFGILNGYLTNWLALKLIFHPEEPIQIFGLNIQGLFIKRQKEVSEAYAKIMVEEVITAEKIFNKMLSGSASNQFIKIMLGYVEKAVDLTAGNSKIIIRTLLGKEKYKQVKTLACERFMEMLPYSLQGVLEYADQVLEIEITLKTKLISLSPKEFVGLLHPVFEEDEWILIAVGAALGGVAGILQLLIM
jgi:uncharacterized membrane protein YheB (UPF0754 family)